MDLPAPVADYWSRHGGVDLAAESAELWERIDWACDSWELERGELLYGGVVSVVHRVRQRGQARVLKAVPRFAGWAHDEARALSLWAGEGAPVLHGSSRDGGLLLMEELTPGPAPDEDALVDLLHQLHGRDARGAGLPDLVGRVDAEFQFARRQPVRAVDDRTLRRCHRLAREWAAYTPCAAILHGDLQPKNIMWRGGVPVAIDPIPSLGDPAYDVAVWALATSAAAHAPDVAAALASRVGCDHVRAAQMTVLMSAAVAAWPSQRDRAADLADLAARAG